ncbi:nitroreductase family deazaflavin-dependent oxidoreductase [Nocardia vermiculata]|uniref:Nitroreductase family deazaflavin-dependent oxidoreductase n=1 Tax=Nocardia vermiculata TaxID=257274 RepID=A0A846Y915_9NOCA|nr:nitroreductase family deazaflavin-dependent oxidoreductase [Nocardia vermiculata]NKY54294.1 nitroreductase family deazaflavin-dependent oxidoreductase [Nocardia vermiculata]
MTSIDGSLPHFFPKWIDRLGVRYVNPWMRRVGPSLPGYAVVEHVGRRSGNRYETPVKISRRGGVLAVLLLHGETQWARNVVAAGEARLRLRGGTVTVCNPRIMPPGAAGSEVPRFVRLGNRIGGIIVFDAV